MGSPEAQLLNGIWALVDSDTPTVALTYTYATEPAGVVFYDHNRWLAAYGPILEQITDAGSGMVITDVERTSLHSHANKAMLDLFPTPLLAESGFALLATGAGTYAWQQIPVNHTHTNKSALDTVPTPTAGQTDYYLKVSGAGAYTVEEFPAIPQSTDFRKGLVGNADLTGNSTGNAYLDGGSTMSEGDWFLITSGGTLTTNTGTNIAVVANDHLYIMNSTTDSTIVDSDLQVVTPAAAGVASIDFGGGGGVQTGVISIDADDIGEGSTNLFLTVAERADVALIDGMVTDISDNETLATHSNRAVLDAITNAGSGLVITALERTTIGTNTTLATHANIAVLDALTNAGSGAVITAAERTALDAVTNPVSGDVNKYWKATGVGTGSFETIPAGTGTVTSVNSVAPDGGGNVSLDADNIPASATRLWLTPTERTDIDTTKSSAAGNASAIARLRTRQTLTDAANIVWDADLGLRGIVTLTANRTLNLITNLEVTDNEARLIVKQDGVGGHTLAFATGYNWPDDVTFLIATAANAVSIISFEIEDSSTIYANGIKTFTP